MVFEVTLIRQALEIMVYGMSGIFLVLFLLYLFSIGLLKLFPVKKEQPGGKD